MRAAVSLLTLAFFAPVAAGCISNEYTIPRDELRRLVMTPPELRGQQVHVVQDLGSRRTDAIATDGPNWPQADPWPQPAYQEYPAEQTRDTDVQLQLDGHIAIDVGGGHGGGYAPNGVARSAWRGSPQGPGGGTTSGNWHGSPPSGGTVTGGGGWRGAPQGGWHGVPPSSGGGSSSGGSIGNLGGGNSNSSSGGGGGGGGGGEAMIVLAVVLAAIAVVAAIGLVSSEGVRFDGMAQMSPWQPVHLKQQGGGELVIALGDLSPVAIDGAVEAKVMDDEGYGIRTLNHLRLDRRMAATFKLDGGSMTFARAGGDIHSGFIANMQFGVYVRPWLGLMLTAGVGGAGDEFGATLTRHTFGFELQSLPWALGPVQLGGYANVGYAALASTASGSGDAEWGKAIGGGILGELQVTSRMALTLRAGANEAFFVNSSTSPAATITGGIAIY